MSLKKLWLLCVLAPLLFTGKASCGDYSSCCPQMCCDPCSDWSIYADWIYWRTRRCQLDYVVPEDVTVFIGDVSEVEPCYDSGFRIGFSKGCGDFYFDAFYTYYRTDENDKITDPNALIYGTRIIPEGTQVIPRGTLQFAEAKWDLDYDTVDILGGYNLCNRNCFEAQVFGGFKYARIDQEMKTLYSDTVDLSANLIRVDQEVDMNAYGLDFGVGAKYSFCGCFNFFGRFSYDVLVGDFDRKVEYLTSTDAGATFLTDVDLKDCCWNMLGVLNLAIGLGYDFQFCDCCVSSFGLAIGYEFHQWTGMPDFLDFIAVSGQNITTFDRHIQSLGFDGLFVRASLGF